MIEENLDSRKMTESISEGSDEDIERTLQNYRTAGEVLEWSLWIQVGGRSKEKKKAAARGRAMAARRARTTPRAGAKQTSQARALWRRRTIRES